MYEDNKLTDSFISNFLIGTSHECAHLYRIIFFDDENMLFGTPKLEEFFDKE